MNISSDGPNSQADGRRSQRVVLGIPIMVSDGSGAGSFAEETTTLVVNAHGALIALAATISEGQILHLTNLAHSAKQNCRVVWVAPQEEGKAHVGVEFTEPAPHFWHIAFPPQD